MAKVLAGITMSIDGYSSAPNDGPGKGPCEGGERLHHWVFGGPWTYADQERREPTGEDAEWLAKIRSRIGAIVGGRWTYEAARPGATRPPGDCPSSSSRTAPRRSRRAGPSRSCRALRPQSNAPWGRRPGLRVPR